MHPFHQTYAPLVRPSHKPTILTLFLLNLSLLILLLVLHPSYPSPFTTSSSSFISPSSSSNLFPFFLSSFYFSISYLSPPPTSHFSSSCSSPPFYSPRLDGGGEGRGGMGKMAGGDGRGGEGLLACQESAMMINRESCKRRESRVLRPLAPAAPVRLATEAKR